MKNRFLLILISLLLAACAHSKHRAVAGPSADNAFVVQNGETLEFTARYNDAGKFEFVDGVATITYADDSFKEVTPTLVSKQYKAPAGPSKEDKLQLGQIYHQQKPDVGYGTRYFEISFSFPNAPGDIDVSIPVVFIASKPVGAVNFRLHYAGKWEALRLP